MAYYKTKLRLNVKVAKDDKQNVINCIPALPTGITMVNQAELLKSHRFIFTFTSHKLVPKLFTQLRKVLKNSYSYLPKNPRKL